MAAATLAAPQVRYPPDPLRDLEPSENWDDDFEFQPDASTSTTTHTTSIASSSSSTAGAGLGYRNNAAYRKLSFASSAFTSLEDWDAEPSPSSMGAGATHLHSQSHSQHPLLHEQRSSTTITARNAASNAHTNTLRASIHPEPETDNWDTRSLFSFSEKPQKLWLAAAFPNRVNPGGELGR